MYLVVVDDRHAERALRAALDALRAKGEAATVLTGDALLAMRLRREGVDTRLTIDGLSPDTLAARDRVALDGAARAFGGSDGSPPPTRDYSEALGTSFGAYLAYTLIPVFIRSIRNVTAVDDALQRAPGSDSDARIMLVGGGPLVDAARLVAARRAVATESTGADFVQRAAQAWARLRAGRVTKWVNTDFRALVLEPGFMWLRFFQGLWRRMFGPSLPAPIPHALFVVGDRFTADVVDLLRDQRRPIVLAGATQPGRRLFDHTPDLVPIEAFTKPSDPLRWIGAKLDAVGQALAMARNRGHGERFTVAGVPYWPLVARTVWLHIVAWVPALRHLQALTARAARACPDARLLTSVDVTAYTRVLIDTARQFGVASTGIQHGIPGEPNGHSIVHVDTLATWGDATEPWYRTRAPQTATFVVTGNPRFDGLATGPSGVGPAASAAPETIGATAGPAEAPEARGREPSALFTVTICTGFVSDFCVGASEYENLLLIDSVLAWAATSDAVRVIHKMHPGEEPEYYVDAARALGWDRLKLTTIREPILHDVLRTSGVLVAAYSTTVLESIVLGTPAIVFDAIVRRRLLPLDRIPGVTIAYSAGELHQQLEARRTGAAPDRLSLGSSGELRHYISELDGQATARVAALLQ